jgi:hypothetical protein
LEKYLKKKVAFKSLLTLENGTIKEKLDMKLDALDKSEPELTFN